MNKFRKIDVIRTLLVNLVPVVGIIFFEWDPFWIAFAYVIETLAIYIVYEVDVYFIDRNSRFPFVFAFLQFFFTMIPFMGMMLASTYIIYWAIKAPGAQSSHLTDGIEKYLNADEVPYLLGFMLLVEFISYYIKKAKQTQKQVRDIWSIFWRILYLNIYLIAAALILSVIPGNAVIFAFFLIGIKVVLDYASGEKDFYKNLRNWLLHSAVGRWFTTSPKTPRSKRTLKIRSSRNTGVSKQNSSDNGI